MPISQLLSSEILCHFLQTSETFFRSNLKEIKLKMYKITSSGSALKCIFEMQNCAIFFDTVLNVTSFEAFISHMLCTAPVHLCTGAVQ